MMFNPANCKMTKTAHSERKLTHDYHLVGEKLREATFERGLGVDKVPRLFLRHHIRRLVKEAN